MHLFTLLRHGRSERNLLGVLQEQLKCHFGNAGYAQFPYNYASRQWSVVNLNNHIDPALVEGNNFWNSD
jgi:hypothetical protein